jgi:hypothetical protein
MVGHGDPGRFVEEYRKGHKNRRRGVLLSWAQVEYCQVPQGMKRVLYPPIPDVWADFGMPCRDDRTVAGYCSLPREPVIAWRPASLGNILLRMGRQRRWVIVPDAHHRGVLWRLPERFVDSVPLLGLEYLLEGSPYNLDTIKQLFQTQKE